MPGLVEAGLTILQISTLSASNIHGPDRFYRLVYATSSLNLLVTLTMKSYLSQLLACGHPHTSYSDFHQRNISRHALWVGRAWLC